MWPGIDSDLQFIENQHLELQFAVHLYGEVQAALRAIRERSTTSALIALTCNQVTRGLMEIEEWLENLGATLNDEIGGYVMDLHHGDWTWSNDQD